MTLCGRQEYYKHLHANIKTPEKFLNFTLQTFPHIICTVSVSMQNVSWQHKTVIAQEYVIQSRVFFIRQRAAEGSNERLRFVSRYYPVQLSATCPEDGGSTLLRNRSAFLPNYTALYPRRPQNWQFQWLSRNTAVEVENESNLALRNVGNLGALRPMHDVCPWGDWPLWPC
jgi:hypothetical protein